MPGLCRAVQWPSTVGAFGASQRALIEDAKYLHDLHYV